MPRFLSTKEPGETASVQCNGVRESTDNRAHVSCNLDLRYQ